MIRIEKLTMPKENQTLRKLRRLIKTFQKLWNEKVKKLVMQGENANVTWKSLTYNITKGILPFAVKASTNILHTPDNLRRWGKTKIG